MNVQARTLGLAALLVILGSVDTASAQSYVLDDFESGERRIVQPSATRDDMKYLWGLYSGIGTTSVVTSDKHDGSHALLSRHTSGDNWQFQLYTYTEGLSGWPNGWQYLRKLVNNPEMNPAGGSPAWPLNRINRLRFWVKLPAGYSLSHPNHNFEFGTYTRSTSTDDNVAESGNGHFYHYLDLRSHGQWEQVIIDTHPDHQRGNSGNVEVVDSPNSQSGYTYFDLMTRFYLDKPSRAVPGDIYMDGFEFYQETNPENTAQIRSLHAAYIPSTNGIEVGWTRPKNQSGVRYEVRYAFSSVRSLGWANATVAPNGTVKDEGDGGYNGMRWTSTGIDVAGRNSVFIAVKPQNSSSFRQIEVQLTNVPLKRPVAPTNVSAQ